MVPKKPKIKDLSPYTIAENCADLRDCDDALNELRQYFKRCDQLKFTPQNTAYMRFWKLAERKKYLSTKSK